MNRGYDEKSVRLLFTPLGKRNAITAETTVDPALFSEDEFPVYCRKCDYELRGLPDGRCPECGTEFQRGRLLVEQYALRARYIKTRMGRFTKRCWIVAFILYVLASLGEIMIDLVNVRSATGVPILPWWSFEARLMLYVQGVALLAFLTGLVGLCAAIRSNGRKRNQVFKAIDD